MRALPQQNQQTVTTLNQKRCSRNINVAGERHIFLVNRQKSLETYPPFIIHHRLLMAGIQLQSVTEFSGKASFFDFPLVCSQILCNITLSAQSAIFWSKQTSASSQVWRMTVQDLNHYLHHHKCSFHTFERVHSEQTHRSLPFDLGDDKSSFPTCFEFSGEG